MPKTIFMVSGAITEKVEEFFTLLKRGDPKTLLIRTSYVPRKGEDIVSENNIAYLIRDAQGGGKEKKPLSELSGNAIKSSMQAALVNKEYEQYVIDRKNIEPADYTNYLYTAKINDYGIISVDLKSREDGITTEDRYAVFISGDNFEPMSEQFVKGVTNHVLISRKTVAEKERLEEGTYRHPLSADEHRDKMFISALALGTELIVVEKDIFDQDDLLWFRKHTLSHRYSDLTVTTSSLKEKTEHSRSSKSESVEKEIPSAEEKVVSIVIPRNSPGIRKKLSWFKRNFG